MAFKNRGDFTTVDNNINMDGKNNINFNEDARYRRFFPYRRFYYVPLDNTYVLMQMIVTFIILIVGAITFFTTYKSSIIDPIENTKKLFLNSYLTTIGILLAITLIINCFSKTEKVLIKRLAIIATISIMSILVFLGIKLNLNDTYNKEMFEEFFVEQNISETTKGVNKVKLNIEMTGINIVTEKEYYISECSKLYGIFTAKFYAILGIHFLLNILLIYQMFKIAKIRGKKDKINKDDLILFDEEQNIKI